MRSKTAEGALYTFAWDVERTNADGVKRRELMPCPMHEEPLHLIPRHLRREFEKMLGVHIEGDLCPVYRYRLKEEFGYVPRKTSREVFEMFLEWRRH